MSEKKEIWLQDGLQILTEFGAEQLTIDHLCRRLGLTKGAFYHHFKNRSLYIEALLQYWERENTLRVIAFSEAGTTPQEKIRLLTKMTTEIPKGPEIALRAWALQEPLVRTYQEKVDQERLAYLAKLVLERTGDPAKARLLAKILYTVFVGAYYLIPNITGDELKEIYQELENLYPGGENNATE